MTRLMLGQPVKPNTTTTITTKYKCCTKTLCNILAVSNVVECVPLKDSSLSNNFGLLPDLYSYHLHQYSKRSLKATLNTQYPYVHIHMEMTKVKGDKDYIYTYLYIRKYDLFKPYFINHWGHTGKGASPCLPSRLLHHHRGDTFTISTHPQGIQPSFFDKPNLHSSFNPTMTKNMIQYLCLIYSLPSMYFRHLSFSC